MDKCLLRTSLRPLNLFHLWPKPGLNPDFMNLTDKYINLQYYEIQYMGGGRKQNKTKQKTIKLKYEYFTKQENTTSSLCSA